MSQELAATDFQQFIEFVEHELDESRARVVGDALNLFQQRQDEIAKIRAALEPALAEFDAGGREPLDIQRIKTEGRERLATEGILDSCPE